MRRNALRKTEGAVALATAAFFCAHEAAGVLFALGAVSDGMSWLAWAGIPLIALHGGLSIATSRQMLHDEERPPSPRKKRHLARKWATGALVAALGAAHVLAPGQAPCWVALTALAAIALAAHVCVAAKSLVADLGLPKRARTPVRAAVIAVTALLVAALLLSHLAA